MINTELSTWRFLTVIQSPKIWSVNDGSSPSITWIVGRFWDSFPYKPDHSSEGERWGRCNLARMYIDDIWWLLHCTLICRLFFAIQNFPTIIGFPIQFPVIFSRKPVFTDWRSNLAWFPASLLTCASFCPVLSTLISCSPWRFDL